MTQQEFESDVSYLVRPLLNDNEHAGFFGDTGTLFAECSEETARSIFHTLSRKFGVGKVKKTEFSSAGKAATIVFENTGEKKLMLQYAKLEIIED